MRSVSKDIMQSDRERSWQVSRRLAISFQYSHGGPVYRIQRAQVKYYDRGYTRISAIISPESLTE
jgi:hypothetical protein